MTPSEKKRLIQSALLARKNAYCPYSDYAVGSAILMESGKIYQGANVENSSYGLSICAERTAIFSAVAAGEKKISALCVVSRAPKPCGACRQVLMEFAGPGCPVLLVDVALKNPLSQIIETTAGNLLPLAFFFGSSKVKKNGNKRN